MLKWFKTLIAILLLPVCLSAIKTLWQVLGRSGGCDAVSAWVVILGGAACWLVIFSMLPKPMWLYVFGHEFTHVLWTWLFGGKVKKFKATARGGHVVVTKTNFLISLAPYFFPVYALVVVVVFLLGHLVWNWMPYVVWFHLLLGAAYAFHLTLTWHILKTEQTDITQHGYIFSGVIIFLGNLAILLVAIPILGSGVTVLTAFKWWIWNTGDVLHHLAQLL